MKGRILGYSGSDFKGLISGHDGQRYDFVRLDWHGSGEPNLGMDVDFQVAGTTAKDIYPLTQSFEQPQAPSYSPYAQPPRQPQPNPAYQYGQPAQAYAQPIHAQTRMGFGEAIQTCFRKYVTFSGRARRAEYWYFTLFSFLGQIVTAILDRAVTPEIDSMGPFTILFLLGLLLPTLAVFTRRMHDTDRSGLWTAGFYISATIFYVVLRATVDSQGDAPEPTREAATVLGFVGLAFLGVTIWALVILCTKGIYGPNRYGPDPLSSQADAF